MGASTFNLKETLEDGWAIYGWFTYWTSRWRSFKLPEGYPPWSFWIHYRTNALDLDDLVRSSKVWVISKQVQTMLSKLKPFCAEPGLMACAESTYWGNWWNWTGGKEECISTDCITLFPQIRATPIIFCSCIYRSSGIKYLSVIHSFLKITIFDWAVFKIPLTFYEIPVGLERDPSIGLWIHLQCIKCSIIHELIISQHSFWTRLKSKTEETHLSSPVCQANTWGHPLPICVLHIDCSG